MKITVITACYNSARTIRDALESVAEQRLPDGLTLEHLVVDGGSKDETVRILKDFAKRHSRTANYSFSWTSEPDRGLYDALNKGITRATGDVIGICNADDVLAADDVIARLAAGFDAKEGEPAVDAVYADIRFVRPTREAGLDYLRALPTVRYCTGKFFRKWMFRFATFPAHPSTFVRRACFLEHGLYSLAYTICADFEMMLRLFVVHGIRARYLAMCTHVMRAGGMSTGGIRSNIAINEQDLRALKAHGVWSCLPLIYLKYFAKVWGLLRR